MQFYKPDSILKKILKLDWLLLLLVLIICLIGIGALYSAGGGSLEPWARNHLYKIFLGFFIVLTVSQFNIDFIMKFSVILFVLHFMFTLCYLFRCW